jgi:DNA-binding NarL/FixJ family response regulator
MGITPVGAAVAVRQGPRVRVSPDARTFPCRHDDGVAPTLLIVDDHAGFRSFARALLESEGYAVVGEAADGVSAVAAVRRLDPSIVLLDIALPDIDGFAVCEKITEGNSERPLVVLTSSRDESTYRDAIARSRARGFIPKHAISAAALAELTG